LSEGTENTRYFDLGEIIVDNTAPSIEDTNPEGTTISASGSDLQMSCILADDESVVDETQLIAANFEILITGMVNMLIESSQFTLNYDSGTRTLTVFINDGALAGTGGSAAILRNKVAIQDEAQNSLVIGTTFAVKTVLN
jgi:hypothetical protein